jgi:hypothetical protein
MLPFLQAAVTCRNALKLQQHAWYRLVCRASSCSAGAAHASMLPAPTGQADAAALLR